MRLPKTKGSFPNSAMKEKVITYEEINDELKEDFPLEQIDKLISGMIEQGIEIKKKASLEKEKKEKQRKNCRHLPRRLLK